MPIVHVDKKVVRVISILTYSVLLFSVATKLFCIPYISEKFHILGISEYCRVLGIVELIAISIFIYRRTIGFGLMLLCGYFGGAIAMDIQSPNYLYQPLVVMTFVLITAAIRKPSLFHEDLTILQRE